MLAPGAAFPSSSCCGLPGAGPSCSLLAESEVVVACHSVSRSAVSSKALQLRVGMILHLASILELMPAPSDMCIGLPCSQQMCNDNDNV